ncbi:hypothetical protein B4Q13_18380 [Lacticaseibacillus rhamnosus]
MNALAAIVRSPHNRNALSWQLVTELFERLERAQADPEVKVVVIRQAGSVFCSGADLTEATTVGMGESARRIVELQRLIVTQPLDTARKVFVGLFTFWYEMTSLRNSLIPGSLALIGWALAIIGLRDWDRQEERFAMNARTLPRT